MSEVKRQGDVSVGADLPSAEDMMNWAFQAVHKREWNKAVDRWALLRKSYPELPVAWVHGSIAHRSLGQYVQAEKLITEAFVRFPKNVNVFVHRIELELERGNLASAEDFSDQAKDLFPSDTNVLWSVVNVHAKKGDIGRAELENCQAREQFPEDSKLTVQFAELAMQQECWGTALERWSEVRELFPDERSGYTRAADAALALGNEPLSRQLRLAQEYGNTWLKGLRSSDEGGGPRPAVSPPQKRSWKGFVALVWTKAQLNLKSEASQNHLRYLWWILDPVLYMAVFYIVFGLMMNRGGPGFIAYLLTGLVPFQWFAKTIGQASGSIVAGKD